MARIIFSIFYKRLVISELVLMINMNWFLSTDSVLIKGSLPKYWIILQPAGVGLHIAAEKGPTNISWSCGNTMQ